MSIRNRYPRNYSLVLKDPNWKANFFSGSSLKLRFKMTRNIMFNTQTLKDFIFSNGYCYRTEAKPKLIFNTPTSSEMKTFSVALGQNTFPFDPHRLVTLKNQKNKTSYEVKSYFYFFHKLEWPYSDRCTNYAKSKFINKYDALASCDENSGLVVL